MKKKKLTPWFSENTKPVRVGVYIISIGHNYTAGDLPYGHYGVFYSFWDGVSWGYTTKDHSAASDWFLLSPTHRYKSFPWRGLMNE